MSIKKKLFYRIETTNREHTILNYCCHRVTRHSTPTPPPPLPSQSQGTQLWALCNLLDHNRTHPPRDNPLITISLTRPMIPDWNYQRMKKEACYYYHPGQTILRKTNRNRSPCTPLQLSGTKRILCKHRIVRCE